MTLSPQQDPAQQGPSEYPSGPQVRRAQFGAPMTVSVTVAEDVPAVAHEVRWPGETGRLYPGWGETPSSDAQALSLTRHLAARSPDFAQMLAELTGLPWTAEGSGGRYQLHHEALRAKLRVWRSGPEEGLTAELRAAPGAERAAVIAALACGADELRIGGLTGDGRVTPITEALAAEAAHWGFEHVRPLDVARLSEPVLLRRRGARRGVEQLMPGLLRDLMTPGFAELQPRRGRRFKPLGDGARHLLLESAPPSALVSLGMDGYAELVVPGDGGAQDPWRWLLPQLAQAAHLGQLVEGEDPATAIAAAHALMAHPWHTAWDGELTELHPRFGGAERFMAAQLAGARFGEALWSRLTGQPEREITEGDMDGLERGVSPLMEGVPAPLAAEVNALRHHELTRGELSPDAEFRRLLGRAMEAGTRATQICPGVQRGLGLWLDARVRRDEAERRMKAQGAAEKKRPARRGKDT